MKEVKQFFWSLCYAVILVAHKSVSAKAVVQLIEI